MVEEKPKRPRGRPRLTDEERAARHRAQQSPNVMMSHAREAVREIAAENPVAIANSPVVDRIEYTGGRMLLFADALIDKAARCLDQLELKTLDEIERASRIVSDLGRVGAEIGRGSVDLRARLAEIQRPIPSNFDEPPKPPIDRAAEDHEAKPFGHLATSNFQQD